MGSTGYRFGLQPSRPPRGRSRDQGWRPNPTGHFLAMVCKGRAARDLGKGDLAHNIVILCREFEPINQPKYAYIGSNSAYMFATMQGGQGAPGLVSSGDRERREGAQADRDGIRERYTAAPFGHALAPQIRVRNGRGRVHRSRERQGAGRQAARGRPQNSRLPAVISRSQISLGLIQRRSREERTIASTACWMRQASAKSGQAAAPPATASIRTFASITLRSLKPM